MAARGKIFRGEDPWLDVLAEEIFVGVGGHGAVGRQIAALGREHEFFPGKPFCRKLLERRADAAFAALKAIIDGAVEEVDSAFCGGDDRSGVDRKSTRLNSSHGYISYAVFCLKKKKH